MNDRLPVVAPTVIDELEVVDGLTETAHNFIPTLEQTTPVASYPDWDPADTRIVVCRIANDVYNGDRYESRDEAIAATTLKYGRILEANYTPGRAFFRVKK